MKFVALDYETHFDSKTYTLSKMTTESYIRDPRFQAHGAAIKFGPDIPARWWSRHELPQLFKEIDWSDVFLLSHHAQFDHLILSHHYGVYPKMSGCTLSMARLLIGNHLSVSLDNVRKHLGMPGKKTPYHLFDGRHWDDMSPLVQKEIGDGACDEVESVWAIFKLFMKDFPRAELEIIDQTIKMFVQPVLRGDIELLGKVWTSEATRKQERMAELNVTEADLQSSNRFAQLLRDEGEEPEMKDGKNGPIFAFAKSDAYMRDYLLEHDNARVRTLAEARLGAKSTLLQTRAETLGFMASRGPMPVYIRYCGAHTTRDSGGDGANWQNFKRGSDIRKAIMAPEGYLLAPIDLSQIEFRILSYLAGQEWVLEGLRRGEDPYLDLASKVYGFTVTKNHPAERGTGKQLKLSCGFQAGAKTIQTTARLGIYGPPIIIDLDTALRWRDVYRNENPEICAPGSGYWAIAGRMISRIAGGEVTQWGPMTIKDKKIFGPGGSFINYTTLEFHAPTQEEVAEGQNEGYWRIRMRNGWSKLYSGRLVENVVQWLARIVMMQAAVRIGRLGYRIVMRTHDELVVLIPKDGREEQHLQVCMGEMKQTPGWLPGIPLDAEGSISERYAK